MILKKMININTYNDFLSSITPFISKQKGVGFFLLNHGKDWIHAQKNERNEAVTENIIPAKLFDDRRIC